MKKLQTLFILFALMTTGTAKAQTFYVCSQNDVSTTQKVEFSNQGTTLNGQLSVSTVDSITLHVPDMRFVGGDMSLLTKYEEQKAQYKDATGKTVSNVLAFVRQQGWNTVRVRLFVNPVKGQAITDDSNKKEVVQDLPYVIALGKRIKQEGLLFLLDFHYSDTYADPAKQWIPEDWQSFNDTQLAQKVYDYTKDCLTQLRDAGAAPDFIQTGNEISYGMLWGKKDNKSNMCTTSSDVSKWNRFFSFLRQATKACREVCPQAKIIIHNERVSKVNVLLDFYDRMKNASIDYDIIGLSYYPYFHGAISVLNDVLYKIEAKNYGKRIQIVETGYPWKWEVPGTTIDMTSTWAYSSAGQQQFVADLIACLKKHPLVNGLSWWWAEANAKGTSGDLNNGWYNAGLFDNQTGKALPALSDLQNFK